MRGFVIEHHHHHAPHRSTFYWHALLQQLCHFTKGEINPAGRSCLIQICILYTGLKFSFCPVGEGSVSWQQKTEWKSRVRIKRWRGSEIKEWVLIRLIILCAAMCLPRTSGFCPTGLLWPGYKSRRFNYDFLRILPDEINRRIVCSSTYYAYCVYFFLFFCLFVSSFPWFIIKSTWWPAGDSASGWPI